jgi:predicted CXXCH cytochrome family protein
MLLKIKIFTCFVFCFLVPFHGYTRSCITADCHQNFKKIKIVHAPVEDDCTACHQQNGKHDFTLKKGEKLCFQCHDGNTEGKHVNEKISAFSCLDCHTPHGGENKGLLKAKRVDAVCYECHDSMNKKVIHKPMTDGDCSGCHGFHSSGNPDILIAPKKQICLKCHTDKDYTGEKWYMHGCLKKGCDVCHDSHSSDYTYQLIAPPGKICVKCHEELIKKSDECRFKHPILEQKNFCLNCHNAHGSEYKHVLKTVPLNLCLDCHKELVKGPGGKTYDIYEVIANSPYKHGPIREGNCSACHDQHGSDYYKTLRGSYPETFYTSFAVDKYALCFKCHKDTLATVEQTTTHTNFRHGNQNLHYVHVNKKKGRTCRACHEVHAGEQLKHIRKITPFGKWNLPIGFKKQMNGGTCAPGCHKAYTYTRDKEALKR